MGAKRWPRLIPRADDELTVHPSKPSPGHALLESVRATAGVVAMAELRIGSPPECDESHVRRLAEALRGATCETCKKKGEH